MTFKKIAGELMDWTIFACIIGAMCFFVYAPFGPDATIGCDKYGRGGISAPVAAGIVLLAFAGFSSWVVVEGEDKP